MDYIIDWDKVKTIDDLIRVFKAIDFEVTLQTGNIKLDDVMDLVRKIGE